MKSYYYIILIKNYIEIFEIIIYEIMKSFNLKIKKIEITIVMKLKDM